MKASSAGELEPAPALQVAEMGAGRGRRRAIRAPSSAGRREVVVDRYRAYVFPNRLREQRQQHGFPKLLQLAARLSEIPYIRLSKIERGEVFARADELERIAAILGISPADLLVDVEAPGFDIARWAEPFLDGRPSEEREEHFAVLLGAALRARRDQDRSLTIAALNSRFGVAPVILSRIENAQKTLGRWNEATIEALLQIFGVDSVAALREFVSAQHAAGTLDPYIGSIANPEVRSARTRARIAELRTQISDRPPAAPTAPLPAPSTARQTPPVPPIARGRASGSESAARLLPVYGAPLPQGQIAFVPAGEVVEAPRSAGHRAFGLRVCRQTLGGGLPAHATVVVDPDRFPTAGDLAVLREGETYRLLAITVDRHGVMKGYSVNPDFEIVIDEVDPGRIAAVLSAVFI